MNEKLKKYFKNYKELTNNINTDENYKILKDSSYQLCLVSPELQYQDDKIEEYKKKLIDEEIELDAICTKYYNVQRWK